MRFLAQPSLFAALSVFLLAPRTGLGAPEDKAHEREIRALVEAKIERNRPGVAILVSRNGEPFHLAGYGLADVIAETPIKPCTFTASSAAGHKDLAWLNGRYDNGNPIRDDDGEGYGLGWVTEKKRHQVSPSGSWNGTATYLLLDLDKGWTVAVLSNDEKTDVSDLTEEILALFRTGD